VGSESVRAWLAVHSRNICLRNIVCNLYTSPYINYFYVLTGSLLCCTFLLSRKLLINYINFIRNQLSLFTLTFRQLLLSVSSLEKCCIPFAARCRCGIGVGAQSTFGARHSFARKIFFCNSVLQGKQMLPLPLAYCGEVCQI